MVGIFIMVIGIVILVIGAGTLAEKLDGRGKGDVEELPEPHEMSWVGKRLMDMYNDIPEKHQPTYDFRAAVVALDVKYIISRLDYHFQNRNSYSDQFDCRCQNYGGNGCRLYPEYNGLRDSIRQIKDSMYELKRAEEQRERAITLAGIDNDLKSVDSIMDSMRAEANLIKEVAKEIRPNELV